MSVLLETAFAAAFALAILGYAGDAVFVVVALVAILLIALIGGPSAFALPVSGWNLPAIAATDIAIVATIRSWRRNICEQRAKGERAWSLILVGPAVMLLATAAAAGLAAR